MSLPLKELGEYIATAVEPQGGVLSWSVELDELCLQVVPQSLLSVLSFLHDDSKCKFEMLIDICGCDYPQREKRFEVVYHLLSTKNNQRIRVKLQLAEGETVNSVTSIYPAAGWFERETWDMYGVFFVGNVDLRRILTDYGFDGHPLRKDFPLTGYVEMRYDEVQKRVIYEPVKLPQEYRSFDNMSPWEGMGKAAVGSVNVAAGEEMSSDD